MWFKLENQTYFNIFTSTLIGTSGQENEYRVEVITPYTGGTPKVLASGFASKEDAQEALDEFFASEDVGQIENPKGEEEGLTEDVEIVSYSELNTEQLRAELAERELSTEGRKPELIARLNENDTARDAAV